MKAYQIEFDKWINSPVLSADERAQLEQIKDNEELKEFRFSAPMDFGTAGLRSTMYLGIGCMNVYTVMHTTRGLAALVKREGGESRGVAIAYDSRNNSREFAVASARVLAGAGIKVFIFDDIRPTPELSYAVRETGALAGINITASHNPKEYNGYKAYWEDGAQISPKQAEIVSEAVGKIDVLGGAPTADLEEAKRSGKIIMLGKETDAVYLDSVMKTVIDSASIRAVSDKLRIVYSPLHGAGYRLVPEILTKAGLKHLYTVDSQMTPDGNFPTVKKPNPEYADVFTGGIEIAERVGSDLIIATDPDADRVGVMCRTKNGSFVTITGNQMGALLLDYVIGARRRAGKLAPDAFAVKSIVSTDMAYAIAEKNGIRLHDVLTGFKFIGEVIKEYEDYGKADRFILGFEESYGYLFGSYARDKDAVGATLMIVEMTAYYHTRGMTLADALDELYARYGIYREAVLDIYMEGIDGIERRRRLMEGLRTDKPRAFASVPVTKIGDYRTGETVTVSDGSIEKIEMPSSDVLYYTLENGDKIIVRPSGTEPKVKVYFLTHGDDEQALEEKIKAYIDDVNGMVDSLTR